MLWIQQDHFDSFLCQKRTVKWIKCKLCWWIGLILLVTSKLNLDVQLFKSWRYFTGKPSRPNSGVPEVLKILPGLAEKLRRKFSRFDSLYRLISHTVFFGTPFFINENFQIEIKFLSIAFLGTNKRTNKELCKSLSGSHLGAWNSAWEFLFVIELIASSFGISSSALQWNIQSCLSGESWWMKPFHTMHCYPSSFYPKWILHMADSPHTK